VVVDPAELDLALAVADPGAEADPTSRRNVEILRSYAARAPAGCPRRIVLRFLLSPVALHPDEHGSLGAVELARNELVPASGGGLRAQQTSTRETISAGLLFRAIGYRGVPLPGVPFDQRAGTIPNAEGRVVDPATGSPLPGEYVVGWIKRGPSGVIGTNKRDAQQTVDAILSDIGSDIGSANGAGRHLELADARAGAAEAMLCARQPQLVTYEGWEEIDRHERSAGEPAGRPRVKLTRIEEMLEIAASEQPSA
jgi:ferredoxin/flavodoxin---NADP+ reductase